MIFKKLAFIALCLLFGSCATYQPASEGIIYHDHDEPYAVKKVLLIPYGEGGGSISPAILPGAIRDEIRRQYQRDDERFEGETIVFRELYLIAPPIYAISIPLARKAALGVSGFPIYPGFDATVHLFEDTWLTGSVQFPFVLLTNTEFILQRPVHRVPNGGLSVGLFYRYEHLNYYREGDRISLYDLVPLHFPIEWMGSRVAWQIPRQFLDTRFRLYFNAGYSTTFDSALFMIEPLILH